MHVEVCARSCLTLLAYISLLFWPRRRYRVNGKKRHEALANRDNKMLFFKTRYTSRQSTNRHNLSYRVKRTITPLIPGNSTRHFNMRFDGKVRRWQQRSRPTCQTLVLLGHWKHFQAALNGAYIHTKTPFLAGSAPHCSFLKKEQHASINLHICFHRAFWRLFLCRKLHK